MRRPSGLPQGCNFVVEEPKFTSLIILHLRNKTIKVGGWKHLPYSDMNYNTVYMIITAMLKNFTCISLPTYPNTSVISRHCAKPLG